LNANDGGSEIETKRAYPTTHEVEETLASVETKLDRNGHTPTVMLHPNG
jgi:hypothetical protein